MAEKFDVLVGRNVVFSYRNDETHERLYLQEGLVDQTTPELVKIAGKWYRSKYIVLEALLTTGASDANQE